MCEFTINIWQITACMNVSKPDVSGFHKIESLFFQTTGFHGPYFMQSCQQYKKRPYYQERNRIL